ncbi:MAG: hypothetical protein PVH61_22525 [Candidatus Aminicenantes bacterium]
MIENLQARADVDLKRLEQIFWDYNIQERGESLYNFVLSMKEIEYLDRNEVMARMLMSVGWYHLIDIFGLKNLRNFLTDDVLQRIWVEDLRDNYRYAREILDQILS